MLLLNFITSKKSTIVLILAFSIVNLYYFSSSFDIIFLGQNSNGDEFYKDLLYDINHFKINQFSERQSQPFIFVSSIANYIVRNAQLATRIVSLSSFVILLIFFVPKFLSFSQSKLEKGVIVVMFSCSLLITNQVYMGTPDFMSSVLIAIGLFYYLKQDFNISKRNSIPKLLLVGILFGLSVATRPTVIVIIFSVVFIMTFFKGLRWFFSKNHLVVILIMISTLALINYDSLYKDQSLVLDIKSIPKEVGVTWFDRNYLMAKLWDSGELNRKQWLSSQDVIDYRNNNPNMAMPTSQIEMLNSDFWLYSRQMARMLFMACYSSFRYLYLLFPFLIISILHMKTKKYSRQRVHVKNLIELKVLVLSYLMSILIFSFLAVKLFEFRWMIPLLILYSYYSLNYLQNYPSKLRFGIYNLSFILSLVMYSSFFLRH